MNTRGACGTKMALTSPKTFGERLRSVRAALAWSQKWLAETLGSNKRLVSHWERDIAKLSDTAMTAVTNLVGTAIEALLTGKGFTILDMPAFVEGVAKETAAQFAVLSRSLPMPKMGLIMLVDADSFESKPLALSDAVKVLNGLSEAENEEWGGRSLKEGFGERPDLSRVGSTGGTSPLPGSGIQR